MKMGDKELRILIGVVLLLMVLFGVGQILSILLVILGVYLIYSGLRKKKK